MFCFFFLSLPHGWLGLPHVRYTRLDAGPELQVPSCRSRAAGPELQAIALFMGLSFTLSGGYLGDVLPMTHGRSASKWIEVCNRRNWHSVPPAHIHWEKPVPWLSCHQWSREVHPTVVGGTSKAKGKPVNRQGAKIWNNARGILCLLQNFFLKNRSSL